ncbi:hypothetical protein POVWA2_046980 [Plasmodium ovale wallikeri]|uniref:Uncharacterized protein n=1 Tax=Plasmodium ovale wallikeri TaxID=864142 RepID=A0A1A8ZI24_PLAOA|nr:hypothetical protein POVWA1_048040 [Plasmodium ovale wallikeri]SBT43956.1 hypothetical protein POVWA2_046980 [Plasmodium ovale wallikeri]
MKYLRSIFACVSAANVHVFKQAPLKRHEHTGICINFCTYIIHVPHIPLHFIEKHTKSRSFSSPSSIRIASGFVRNGILSFVLGERFTFSEGDSVFLTKDTFVPVFCDSPFFAEIDYSPPRRVSHRLAASRWLSLPTE